MGSCCSEDGFLLLNNMSALFISSECLCGIGGWAPVMCSKTGGFGGSMGGGMDIDCGDPSL